MSAGAASASARAAAAILVVDDHAANRLALRAILEPLGHRLVEAGSAEEALRRVLQQEFAVILLDVQMPGISGFEAAALIKQRERSRYVPIIFLTAISKDPAHVLEGYAHGAVDYLMKPFDPEVLRSKVSVFVELFQKSAQLKRQEALLREKEREALERRSEHRYRTLTDSLPDCVIAARRDGELWHCNQTFVAFTGRSLEACRNGALWEAVHDEDREALRERWRRAIAHGEPAEADARLRRAADGAWRWHHFRIAPERDEAGELAGWIATATDVHERRAAETALVEFRATLDATLDCVFILGAGGRIVYANEGAAAHLGFGRAELVGRTVAELFADVADAELEGLLAELRDGRARSRALSGNLRTKAGGELPVELVLQYVAPPGAEARFVGVARDLTALKRTEDELRHALRAKDDFLAAATHELRTPLTAAKTQAQLALRRIGPRTDEPTAKSLRSLERQIDRMTKLVEDLLDVARLRIGRLRLELAEVDVAPLVRELCERFEGVSAAHELRLDLFDHAPITCDRGRLEQVVVNLLQNAIRYAPSGGPIEVRLAPAEGGGVHLSVRDHGVGIPAAKQALIFERFGQAHGAGYGGLGIGLTICQGIVEQHGGRIWVESEGEGRGSTFHVLLPRRPGAPPHDDEAAVAG